MRNAILGNYLNEVLFTQGPFNKIHGQLGKIQGPFKDLSKFLNFQGLFKGLMLFQGLFKTRANNVSASLLQALCQCGRGRRAGSGREKRRRRPLLFTPGSPSQLIPLVARSLFRPSSLTESLEQATCQLAWVCKSQH